MYEDRQRTGDGFEPGALQEVGELASMRHFDIANRDRSGFTLVAEPACPASTSRSSFGRRRPATTTRTAGTACCRYDSNQSSVGFNIAPDDRYELYGELRAGKITRSLQRSRNASDGGRTGESAARLDDRL